MGLNTIALAFDVGGTNTRARMAVVRDGEDAVPAHDDVVTQSRSARELYEFVTQIVWEAQKHGTVTASVVAVAGPITGTTSRMSNWPGDPVIERSALELAGLPRGATDLVNDVVAGAWGALARLRSRDRMEALSAHASAPDLSAPGAGSLVYLAPGTGLGASALVHQGLGSRRATAVACEAQHTQIPRFPGDIEQVAEVAEFALGYPPSWEDLVSGRGLVRIYDALGTPGVEQPAEGAGDERAADIAAAALVDGDPQAIAAINVFYRALGHFAQMLALTYLPCGVVVIGGTTTEQNLGLIRQSGFVETFATHRRFADLLGAVPLFAVGGDVNLEGGIWLAAHPEPQ